MKSTRIHSRKKLQGNSVFRVSFVVVFFVVTFVTASLTHATILVPSGLNPGDKYHLMFNTSTNTNAVALAPDISLSDAFVQSAADAAGIGMTCDRRRQYGPHRRDDLPPVSRQQRLELRRRRQQQRSRDIDGHVRRRLDQLVEQQSRLQARAAPEFHQEASRSEAIRHPDRLLLQNRDLGPRGIVLLEACDVLEQPGAYFIVEELAGEPFW